MGYPLGGTNPPKIGVYDHATDTLQTGFGTAGYYNLPQVWEGSDIDGKLVEIEFEKTTFAISTYRAGIKFESIGLVWRLKDPVDLVNFEAIINISPATYYLKLWIHNDDSVSHKVKVKKFKFKPHGGKMYKYDVELEFEGIEVEATLNLDEA